MSEQSRIYNFITRTEVVPGEPVDPSPFLEELGGYLTVEDDAVLLSELRQNEVMGRILTLAKVREAEDLRWAMCEPVLRQLWNRAADLIFSRHAIGVSMRASYHREIFGEEEPK